MSADRTFRRLIIAVLPVALPATWLIACNPRGTRAAARDSGETAAIEAAAAPAAPAAPVSTPVTAPPPAESMAVFADRNRIRGDSTAPIWVVEVSDFQCPYCRMWHRTTYPMVLREYVATGKVRLAYLNFPIPSHAHAWTAAEAAMCAGTQGRFWQYHDALFGTQDEWSELASSDSAFAELAGAVGLNVEAWQQCRSTDAVQSVIVQDVQRVQQTGVRSTPTFFIGDTAVVGALPPDMFRAALESQLTRARQGRPTPNRE